MEFIETPTFTRLINALMTDEHYRQLQNELIDNPVRGVLIKGGGGLRKLRFSLPGIGKRGGVRVIYYWISADEQIYMLLVYPKSDRDTLTDTELAVLRNLVKDL